MTYTGAVRAPAPILQPLITPAMPAWNKGSKDTRPVVTPGQRTAMAPAAPTETTRFFFNTLSLRTSTLTIAVIDMVSALFLILWSLFSILSGSNMASVSELEQSSSVTLRMFDWIFGIRYMTLSLCCASLLFYMTGAYIVWTGKGRRAAEQRRTADHLYAMLYLSHLLIQIVWILITVLIAERFRTWPESSVELDHSTAFMEDDADIRKRWATDILTGSVGALLLAMLRVYFAQIWVAYARRRRNGLTWL